MYEVVKWGTKSGRYDLTDRYFEPVSLDFPVVPLGSIIEEFFAK